MLEGPGAEAPSGAVESCAGNGSAYGHAGADAVAVVIDGGIGKRDDSGQRGRKHLVVLVHGLFGSDKHLANVVRVMEANFGGEGIDVYVSKTNRGVRTLQGIEKCGERLMDEIDDLLQSAPGYETISFVGHSLGG